MSIMIRISSRQRARSAVAAAQLCSNALNVIKRLASQRTNCQKNNK
jgi:hypothetical protein